VEAIASIEPGKFKQYVLGKKYHKAQLKTLRTHVFDVFEDEDNDEITEEQYMEIVEFRNELRVYAETMNCLFSLGTMGNLFFFHLLHQFEMNSFVYLRTFKNIA
jgi:hypothetical protein